MKVDELGSAYHFQCFGEDRKGYRISMMLEGASVWRVVIFEEKTVLKACSVEKPFKQTLDYAVSVIPENVTEITAMDEASRLRWAIFDVPYGMGFVGLASGEFVSISVFGKGSIWRYRMSYKDIVFYDGTRLKASLDTTHDVLREAQSRILEKFDTSRIVFCHFVSPL